MSEPPNPEPSPPEAGGTPSYPDPVGPPALGKDAEGAKAPKRAPGALLSLPEVIFGRRVKPTALVLLGLVALLIGAAGGMVGWIVGRGGDVLTSDVTLAQVQPGKERPSGS